MRVDWKRNTEQKGCLCKLGSKYDDVLSMQKLVCFAEIGLFCVMNEMLEQPKLGRGQYKVFWAC
jgi:hypothetical protein